MTSADGVTFIQLWQQGLDTRAVGQELGIPRGTVNSRAATLVRQGKIQPRPRVGAYPRQQALARQEGAPVQSIDTGAVQPFDTGPVQRLDRLEDEVQGLRELVQAVRLLSACPACNGASLSGWPRRRPAPRAPWPPVIRTWCRPWGTTSAT
jgi:hypothetical protein